MKWYIAVLKKYEDFSGRAHRKEYWMFWLINLIIQFGLVIFEVQILPESGTSNLSSLYSLIILFPTLAVTVRRLHDIGRSGWWLLLGLVPLIGPIVLFIFMLTDSEPGENQYGLNPNVATAI
ncbi:MAG: DUF805 domain-containing protein [Candidatus Hermodarchaeia archaeon]|jgi:uncharacterized membrane protein YhaH (DUF805 family)